MKKYAIILFLTVALAVLPACGGQSTSQTEVESQEPAITFDEYKTMVSDFNSRIMDESIILANVGMYEYNYWNAYSGISEGLDSFYESEVDYEAMVTAAMEWLSENADSDAATVAATYNELIATYADISEANVDGGVPTDTTDLIDALFGAYYQLYKMVTEPSGAIEDFVYTLKDCTDAITIFNADLTTALDT